MNKFLAAATMGMSLFLAPLASAAATPELQATIDSQLTGARILVVDYDGIVILRGSVVSAEQKSAAEQIVRESGRERVANLVRIVPTLTDDELRVRIEREMVLLRAIGVSEISVRATDGVVYIGGVVAEDAHRTVVDSIARIPGVRQVVLDVSAYQR